MTKEQIEAKIWAYQFDLKCLQCLPGKNGYGNALAVEIERLKGMLVVLRENETKQPDIL